MRNTHEPDDNFVEKLEWQIGREVRRRNSIAAAPGWVTWSRARLATAAAVLIIVSMAIGGAAVAATYEAQNNQRKDQLASNYEQRLDLAKRRLAIVSEQMQNTQERKSAGLATEAEQMEARGKLGEAQADVKTLELALAEVRVTGHEPRIELSAPLAGGRDFVSDRLRIAIEVPRHALALESARLKEVQKRFDVGVADEAAVEMARVRVVEIHSAVETFDRKIAIRQAFLKGQADAVETDLRVLEAEADQLTKTLKPKLDLITREMSRIKARVEVGTANSVELEEATIRRLELEMQLRKAELDLMLLQKRIQQYRATGKSEG
jgi:outer membrane protein TolC